MKAPAHQSVLLRTLRTTEYFTLAFGSIVGVGWLIVIEDWLARGGPGGAMLGFLLGGLALVPIAWVYGRFVQEMPEAGSELAYASAAISKPVGFLAAWMMTLAYLIVCPWEAVALGKLAAYLVPAVQSHELYRVAGHPVYLPALALGLSVTAAIAFLNYRGVRPSAGFQNAATFGLLLLFVIFTILGLGNGRLENCRPWFSPGAPNAAVAIILVLQIVPYFMTGFESVPKCSEEAREGYDPRGFMRAIFLGLGVAVLFYVIVIGVVAGLQPWRTLLGERYATAVAFERALRSSFGARVIIAAALISLLKVFNANFLTATRLVFALGRDGRIPAALGAVHPRFRSPAPAVLLCAALTCGGALLGDSILIPVTEVGSLCSAFGWGVTCFAYRRHLARKGVVPGRILATAGASIAVLLLAIKLVPAVPGSFRTSEYLALGAWLALGAVLSKIQNR
jgi:APA family basic amino acid/polyamine antiporter